MTRSEQEKLVDALMNAVAHERGIGSSWPHAQERAEAAKATAAARDALLAALPPDAPADRYAEGWRACQEAAAAECERGRTLGIRGSAADALWVAANRIRSLAGPIHPIRTDAKG